MGCLMSQDVTRGQPFLDFIERLLIGKPKAKDIEGDE